MRVLRVAEEVSGHVRLKPYPKSRAGRRTVPLPLFVVQLLIDHAGDYPPGEHRLVFTTRVGEPIKRGIFRARVSEALAAPRRAPDSAALPRSTALVRHMADLRWRPGQRRGEGHGTRTDFDHLDRYNNDSTRYRDRRVLGAFAAFSLPERSLGVGGYEEGPSEEGP